MLLAKDNTQVESTSDVYINTRVKQLVKQEKNQKACDLQEILLLNKNVILTGDAGSGKSVELDRHNYGLHVHGHLRFQ